MSISEHGHAAAPKSNPTVLRPRRLVGRDSELRDVRESVTSAPVTTLVGPGGVGKTALAVAVGAACSREFPGGVHPQIQWTETAGYKYGGVYGSPQAVLENVFAKIQVDFESFSIDVERMIDAGDVVVVQAHYVAKGKATGKSVRAAVAHVLELSDGKIVRFDQYVDSATINPVIAA